MSMVQRDYRSNKFVIGLGIEKLAGSSFSGYNSKAGDLLTLKLKHANASIDLTGGTHKMFYVLHYDSILQINDLGVSVLE